jgi:hypothetical protein
MGFNGLREKIEASREDNARDGCGKFNREMVQQEIKRHQPSFLPKTQERKKGETEYKRQMISTNKTTGSCLLNTL